MGLQSILALSTTYMKLQTTGGRGGADLKSNTWGGIFNPPLFFWTP